MFNNDNPFSSRREEDSSTGLMLAPMVDVVFLLLIFFMVTTTFVVRPGLDLQLPEAKSRTNAPENKWVISITPEGKYYLNKDAVTLTKLSKKLKSNPKPVTVRADRSVPHGLVVTVLDTVQLAGIETVTVSARKPSGV